MKKHGVLDFENQKIFPENLEKMIQEKILTHEHFLLLIAGRGDELITKIKKEK